MQIVADDTALAPPLRGAAIALGNFDGVHRGHQKVIAETAAVARARGLKLGAAVFEPHPRQFFQPQGAPFRLQSPGQRARALAALGVDLLLEIKFDGSLAARTDAQFVSDILLSRFGAAHIAVGEDFSFGKGRMGDAASLERLAGAEGVSVSRVPVLGGADKISSSTIRAALTEGRMADAAALLTRPWAIEGVVLPGAARGRTIGFPTMNVPLGAYQRPAFGVYATLVDIGGGALRPGVANLGVRPSVGGDNEPLLEIHLFDYEGDLYGRRVEAQLFAFIRPEHKFENFDALKAQIAADAAQAKRLLA